jgi:NDP-sugar pyrophosphorylase family protein
MSHRTADRPKAMIEVAGEPFIRHQLRLLHDSGVDDVIVCTGHRGEVLRDEVNMHHPDGMIARCVDDGERLMGTAGAIRRVIEDGLADEEFMVLYGDSYLPVDFSNIWATFDAGRYRALMTVWRNDDAFDNSNAIVADGRVVLYRKGADRSDHPEMDFIDYGLSIFTAEVVLDLVPERTPYDLASVYEIIALHRELQAFEVFQRFHEIGSESGLAELDEWLTTEHRR